MWSENAEELLLGTAAKESHLGGLGLVQLGGGPALGIYQIEPKTEYDNWFNYINYRPALSALITAATGLTGPDPYRLRYDPVYGSIMARVWYKRRPGALPSALDVPAMANYWNDQYNINPDAGSPDEFIELYYKLVRKNDSVNTTNTGGSHAVCNRFD